MAVYLGSSVLFTDDFYCHFKNHLNFEIIGNNVISRIFIWFSIAHEIDREISASFIKWFLLLHATFLLSGNI